MYALCDAYEMTRFGEPPAGCIIYFMLSIVINLLILILRISAQEVQNTSTLATPIHRFGMQPTIGKSSETGKYIIEHWEGRRFGHQAVWFPNNSRLIFIIHHFRLFAFAVPWFLGN